MEPEAEPVRAEVAAGPRNWFALAAFWTFGIAWLGYVAVVFYTGFLDNEPSENVGWVLLAIATLGFILTLPAHTAARTRGDVNLAWAALALALVTALAWGAPSAFTGSATGSRS